MTPEEISRLPYRRCVGVMLANPAGHIFVGQRLDNDTPAWQMPQGGIDEGETPLDAARRELFEETSIRTTTLIAEAPNWISYDYPPEVARSGRTTRYRGQTQKWFAFRFEGDEAEIDILNPPDGHKPEFCDWRWARASELPDLIIPFKRATYVSVVDAFAALTA